MNSKRGRWKKTHRGPSFHLQPVFSLTSGDERFLLLLLFFFLLPCLYETSPFQTRETRLAIEQAFYVHEARQWQRMQSAFVSIASQFPMPMDSASNKNMPIQREKKTMRCGERPSILETKAVADTTANIYTVVEFVNYYRLIYTHIHVHVHTRAHARTTQAVYHT